MEMLRFATVTSSLFAEGPFILNRFLEYTFGDAVPPTKRETWPADIP
jgi:hypothetical protein